LLANHASGLPAATLQTLGVCGNPNSGFFDPLLGVIPSILSQLTSGPGGGPSATALAALIAKGMTMIPGAADIQPPAATAPAPSAASAAPLAPSLSTPGTSQLPPLPTVPSAPPSSGGGLGGFLKSLLGDL
jgi:hypothetical protein